MNFNPNFENVKDLIFNAILKYKNQPSIIAIREKSKYSKFTFHEVDNNKIVKEIMRLKNNKASQNSDILITIINENADIFADILDESLNGAIKTWNNFPNSLELADITPLNKKGRKDSKENYKPAIILSELSKLLEKNVFFEKMSVYFETFPWDQRRGCWKGYSTQCWL